MLTEDMVPVVKMFACFDRIRIFYILSAAAHSYVKKSVRLSNTFYSSAE